MKTISGKLLSLLSTLMLSVLRKGECAIESGSIGQSNSFIVYSDIPPSAYELYEENFQTFLFNFTFSPPTDSTNHSLSVCVWVEDAGIASLEYTKELSFDLDSDPSGVFNLTVQSVFVGRTYLHILYAFSSFSETSNIQRNPCLQDEETTVVKFFNGSFNITDIFAKGEKQAAYSSVHEIVSVRLERPVDVAFKVRNIFKNPSFKIFFFTN